LDPYSNLGRQVDRIEMSSPTNSYNDTTYMAYMAEIRQYITNRKAGDTGQQNISPDYNIPIYPDICQISDAATTNQNQQTPSDLCSCSDSLTNRTANTGQWEIPFDAANSTGVTNPIIEVGCFDIGY